ncbi:MAG: site-specific DNA-methyltransferase [Gammaproteobacteria bacterium]|nr:site-specific DNA-methyltransferase [Gammaproteobacteria bacterium]
MHSPNLTQKNISRIRELFPGCVTEAHGANGELKMTVDFDQLRQELSDSIVEGPQERYHLNWPGKCEALLTANTQISKTLRPCREESVEFDTTKNLFIEGDNLEALKLLQETYLGKVKMIYIDPPYNTGKDFVYKDNFTENEKNFLERTGQKDNEGNRLVANSEANGRFHSSWLSMIFPRLKLARNLLTDDGVIFISIDDREVNSIMHVCSEIFGRNNHVATFIWKSKSGGANDSGSVAVDHEYILCFAKEADCSPLSLDPDGVTTTSYNLLDDNGRYSLERLDKQSLQYSASLDYKITGPDGTIYHLPHKNPKQPNAIWRWSKDRVKAEMSNLVFKKGNIYTKNYEKTGIKPRSLLINDRFGRTRTGSTELRKFMPDGGFDNPKPTKLIDFLVNIGSRSDSIVLDFFSGSCSTAHSVINRNAEQGENRQFIMVQLPEKCNEESRGFRSDLKTIAEVGKERIRLIGKSIRGGGVLHKNWGKDIGFRVLKIDTTNMADVYYTPDAIMQDGLKNFTDNIKVDRSPDDLLFQVLLDWGVDLSLPIRSESVNGKIVFFVDENALIACFDTGVDEDLVKNLAQHKPLRVVFRDSGYVSDAVKINVVQIFRQISPSTEVRSL